MAVKQPTHLLSTLGILAQFNIAKRISKKEIDATTKKIKKIFKEENPNKFQKLLVDALIAKTKKYVSKEMPPGLIFPKQNPKKDELDIYYMELSSISQALSNKFQEQKLTKDQLCFILNATINILGVTESDFEEFHKRFQKYKNDDFSEDEE